MITNAQPNALPIRPVDVFHADGYPHHADCYPDNPLKPLISLKTDNDRHLYLSIPSTPGASRPLPAWPMHASSAYGLIYVTLSLIDAHAVIRFWRRWPQPPPLSGISSDSHTPIDWFRQDMRREKSHGISLVKEWRTWWKKYSWTWKKIWLFWKLLESFLKRIISWAHY